MINIKTFTFGPVEENTYVVYDKNNNAAIIDCGVSNAHEQQKLKSFIEENNLTIKILINTHMHFDHAWGNPWVKETFENITCYAAHKDIDGLPSIAKQIERFMPVSGLKLDLQKDNYQDIKQGETIKLGDIDINILEVPGHSPGHVALYIKEENVVMTGDALFCEGIGRTDLWGGDYSTLINSIKTELLTLPDKTVVYSGHGPRTTIGHEKANNPFLY